MVLYRYFTFVQTLQTCNPRPVWTRCVHNTRPYLFERVISFHICSAFIEYAFGRYLCPLIVLCRGFVCFLTITTFLFGTTSECVNTGPGTGMCSEIASGKRTPCFIFPLCAIKSLLISIIGLAPTSLPWESVWWEIPCVYPIYNMQIKVATNIFAFCDGGYHQAPPI